MNEGFEEVEAILKPTVMKRKIILLIITIALSFLTALSILTYNQVDYLQVLFWIICKLGERIESHQSNSKYF